MLALRLGAATIAIGLLAGGVASLIETRRTERAAMALAEEGARHFQSSAMQMLLDAGTADGHSALARLLDRTRFVGIRVFSRDARLAYETWADVPTSVIEPVRSHSHVWPTLGTVHRNRIEIAGEHLIQVLLPLTANDGRLIGYLEGIYRLDRETLRHQREQIRNGAVTAAASVAAAGVLLYPLLLAMLRHSTRLSARLLDSNLSLIRSLGNAVAKRDSGTDAHNYRVTLYAVALAEHMALPSREIADLMSGAFLHDVGKIGIPDRILLKPGRLSGDELELMKSHVLLGLDIVAGNAWLAGAVAVIRYHHERFDGTGYPDGRCGEAIPRNARIFAVVDVFDALTSARPYKGAIPLAEALTMLERDAGRHFDPTVVTAFKQIASTLYARIAQAAEAAASRPTASRWPSTGRRSPPAPWCCTPATAWCSPSTPGRSPSRWSSTS